MPASLIVPVLAEAIGFSATGMVAAALTFGIRLATAYVLGSLLTKNQTAPTGPVGGLVQLPPGTDNKLPVVYGESFVSPIIIDAILTTDQQTMYYVLAFSEANSLAPAQFEEVYWDDKLLLFNSDGTINGWWVVPSKNRKKGGEVVTGVAGDIQMWFYNNGSSSVGTNFYSWVAQVETPGQPLSGSFTTSTTTVTAYDVLSDPRIDSSLQWSAATQERMDNCIFAIVKINYDANHGIQGIGNIRAKLAVLNSEGNPYPPGTCMLDYMTNTSYGCALPINTINTNSFALLDSISQEPKELTIEYYGTTVLSPTTSSSFTYQLNGIVDTTQDCLTNLQAMADSCDSWISWDETLGQWRVIPNESPNIISAVQGQGNITANTRTITMDHIIGGIDLLPNDLKGTPNKVSIQYPNVDILNQTDYAYYFLDNSRKSPNEPENNLDIHYPFVNNLFQAMYLGYKKLWYAREDLGITFTMDYSGIDIDAGDVIAIQHEWYGWDKSTFKDNEGNFYPGKPFRVTQVKEMKSAEGFLSVQISAVSYNDEIYYLVNPLLYTPSGLGVIGDPNIISAPGTPTITYNSTSTQLNGTTATIDTSFVVSSTTPSQGNVTTMEFWYSNSPTIGVPNVNNFILYDQQLFSNSPYVQTFYPNTTTATTFTESINVLNLPAGTYYWASRAVGPNAASPFSGISAPVVWNGIVSNYVSGQQILTNSITGSSVATGDPAQPASNNGGFFSTLGGVALAGLGLAGGYYAYKQGWSLFGEKDTPAGGGEGGGEKPATQTTDIKYADADGNDTTDNPQVGDTQTITVAANQTYDSPDTYTNFDDVPDGGDTFFT